MAITKTDFSTTVNTLVSGIFVEEIRDASDTYQPLWPKKCKVINLRADTEIQPWLGDLGDMNVWTDQRIFEEIYDYQKQFSLLDWQMALAIDRNTLEDDYLDLVRGRIRRIVDRAMTHRDRLLTGLQQMADGTTGAARTYGLSRVVTSYDGVTFYATTHLEGAQTTNQSNLHAGSALTAANLKTAMAHPQTWLSDRLMPMDLRYTHIEVPPALELDAAILVNSALLPGGTNNDVNVLKGIVEVMVNPWLTNTDAASLTTWYGHVLDGPDKPFVMQFHKSRGERMDFLAKDQPTDDNVAYMKRFHYMVDGRYDAGLGLHYLTHQYNA